MEEGSECDGYYSATGGVDLRDIFFEVEGDYSATVGVDSEVLFLYDGKYGFVARQKMRRLSQK